MNRRFGMAALVVLVSATPVVAQVPSRTAAPASRRATRARAPHRQTPPRHLRPDAAPPAAPPPLPTTGVAVPVLSALDHACIPLIGGKDAKAVAQAAGMRINGDGDLYLSLDGGQKIVVQPPSLSNPTNCAITVTYGVGGGDAMLDGLQAWAAQRPTPLPADKVAQQTPEDGGVSVISTWAFYGTASTEGLMLVQHKKADGSPLNANREEAEVLFSIRPN